MATVEEFNKLLQLYTEQFLLFVTTGIPMHKQAYEQARDTIENTLSAKQSRLESQRSTIREFATSLDQDQLDIPDLEGVNEAYHVAKTQYETVNPAPGPDTALGYSIMFRIGLIFLSVAVLFMVGFFAVA
jgi:hypothetical protein